MGSGGEDAEEPTCEPNFAASKLIACWATGWFFLSLPFPFFLFFSFKRKKEKAGNKKGIEIKVKRLGMKIP